MNNEAERFFQSNGETINQVIESLDALISKIDMGIIPGEPQKSNALFTLSLYLSTLMNYRVSNRPPFEKTIDNKQEFDENSALMELAKNIQCVSLLMRLGREKLIRTDDKAFVSECGKQLLLAGYCDEIVLSGSDVKYYILSEKGEAAIKCKKLLASFRDELATAVMPKGLIKESYKWSNLYVRRVEMINRYFKDRESNAEHIVFTLDESKDMVFGCEINNSTDVNYVFAGIFDEKVEEHIESIKYYMDSGRIDKLIILSSSSEGRVMMEKKGLTEKNYPQIAYEILK